MYPFRDLKSTTAQGHSGIDDLTFLQVRAIVSPIIGTCTVLTERHFTCFVAGSRGLELVPQTAPGHDAARRAAFVILAAVAIGTVEIGLRTAHVPLGFRRRIRRPPRLPAGRRPARPASG